MPAGSVVLLASASHVAAVGAADYAADYVGTSGLIQGAFAGSVTVMHGISFLLGGTSNSPALRALAEVEHWVKLTLQGTDTISASRAIWADSLTTDTSTDDQQIIIRLPISQKSLERCTYISTGFNHLKTAVDPISEDFEKYLLGCLIDELNNLFPVGLSTDFVCDRFADIEVFNEHSTDHTALVLIGASHLRRVANFVPEDNWRVVDLTTPGWRISDASVREKIAELEQLADNLEIEKSVVVLQLYDNSVYMAGGPGGVKHLPAQDSSGLYHVDGPFLLADKAGVKDLMTKLFSLIKALGTSKKLVLSPLGRYWRGPCCSDAGHITNYREPGYLSDLSSSLRSLRDNIRGSLFTKKIPNFRVLCLNWMLGLEPRSTSISEEDVNDLSMQWGDDPINPTAAAYKKIAAAIIADLDDGNARYTNPPRTAVTQSAKKPIVDLSLERADWVRGCPAALPRRDSLPGAPRGSGGPRGHWAARARPFAAKRGMHFIRGRRGF